MKFTVSENKLEGVIFSVIDIMIIIFFPFMLSRIGASDEGEFLKIVGMLFFGGGFIWLFQMALVAAVKSFYDHINIDGETMTVYQLFTKPLTVNCHDWDKIYYNQGLSTSLEFFCEEHYKKEKYRPVYKTGFKNYDELLLYLKKNNVELVERL